MIKKGSVRHNLSLHSNFVRVKHELSDNFGYWTLKQFSQEYQMIELSKRNFRRSINGKESPKEVTHRIQQRQKSSNKNCKSQMF